MIHRIYEIKIELEEIEPEIWRKIKLPANVKLHKAHEIFQIAMGWTNSHLHQLIKGKKIYMDPELDDLGDTINEKKYKLEQMLKKPKDKLQYEYDFGDGWLHKITLNKISELDKPIKHAICTGGKRACPPEDVGGISGYMDLLDALSDPEHEEHEEYIEWVGIDFDSEKFDIKECNKYLKMLNLTRKQDLYPIMVKRFG